MLKFYHVSIRFYLCAVINLKANNMRKYKLKKYNVLFKGEFFSLTFHARNKKELRTKVLNFLEVDRMPYKTIIW